MMQKTLGRIAYESYARAFPGTAAKLALPWERLGEGVRLAWEAAAQAVRR